MITKISPRQVRTIVFYANGQKKSRPKKIGILKFLLSEALFHNHAVCSGLLKDRRDTVLVDCSDGRSRHFQGDPLVFLRDVESLLLKVRIEPSFGFNIRVRNVVSYLRFLSCYIANF